MPKAEKKKKKKRKIELGRPSPKNLESFHRNQDLILKREKWRKFQLEKVVFILLLF